jgi:hypothetical protein
LFALLDEGEDGGQIEKPRAFNLPRVPDTHGADQVFPGQLGELGAAEPAVKVHALFGAANPDGQAVLLVV